MSIPRRLLIHTVKLYKWTGTDEYGKRTFQDEEDATEIKYVRLQPVKKTGFTSLGEFKDDTFKMFYDYTNSTSATIERGDKVVFDSLDNFVREIEVLYDVVNRPHHSEIRLKGSEG